VITQHAAEQAITLADRGWSVSAIARHLDHDRKTIRIYLNGRRKPGQPREQADSFAPFAAYATHRLRADPHLRAAGLHRELGELGYTGSYSALTRELRSSAIPTVCPDCHDTPEDTYRHASRARTLHRQTGLPMRVAPISGETIASYLGRVGAANHLPVNILLAHLPPWFIARSVTHDDLTGATRAGHTEVERLAALTGLAPATLLRALPAFGANTHRSRPPVRATRACRGCTARHGHTRPVPVHLPAHQRICAKHRIWLGDALQINLDLAPEIVHAHHRADRLGRHSGLRLILAEATERQQIITAGHDTRLGPIHHRTMTMISRDRRLTPDHPDLIDAATYPETIANAAIRLHRSNKPITGPD
jgi:hypothetical protein